MSTETVAEKQMGKKPVSRKEMSMFQWTLKEMKRNYAAYLMCFPFYFVFILFTIGPVILSLFFSFTIFNLIEAPQFVFFENYVRLFVDDDVFLTAVQNTLIFAAITGPALVPRRMVYKRASPQDKIVCNTYLLCAVYLGRYLHRMESIL